MADDDEERPQDPHVERLRPDPAQPPQQARTLIGFLGDSDRAGMRRLYFSEALDYYAEFRTDDVLSLTPVPAEEAPFPGHEVTKVMLRRDATVDYTHTQTAGAADEFDLDVRLGAPESATLYPFPTRTPFAACVTVARTCYAICETVGLAFCQTPGIICRPTVFLACHTRQQTCAQTCTCNTQCGQNTCAQTCTCNTQCGQNTCVQTDWHCTKNPCCP